MESIPSNPILEFQPDTLEYIRKLYDLNKTKMTESVDILEEWVKKQNHFLKKDFSREYLEKTIITSKGSVERAKSRIDKLCTLKTLLPNFFIDCNVKRDLKSTKELFAIVTLPKMTSDYYRIVLIKVFPHEFSSSNIMKYYRLLLILGEYLKAHDYINGLLIVLDYRDIDLMNLVTSLNIIELQHFMTILTGGFGARLKGIYILSQSKVVDLFVKTMKPMFSPKVSSRIHVHKTLEELNMVVDRKLLPAEYGGEEKSIYQLQDDWIELLSSKEFEMYFNTMNKACTDESCRQTDNFNEQYMGTPGSFRTLTVD